MRTIYCDFHSGTLKMANEADLVALLAEIAFSIALPSGTKQEQSAFDNFQVETHLQSEQSEWIERLENMTKLELCVLAQQVSNLLRSRQGGTLEPKDLGYVTP